MTVRFIDASGGIGFLDSKLGQLRDFIAEPRIQYSREVSSGHPDSPAADVLHAVGGELLEDQVG